MPRALVVLPLLALLVVLPTAAAGATQLSFTAGVPTRFAGAVEARSAGAWILTDEAPSTLRIDGDYRLTLHTLTAEYARVGDTWVRLHETPLATPLPGTSSELGLQDVGDDFVLQAHAAEVRSRSEAPVPAAKDAWPAANVQTGLLLAPRSQAPSRPAAATGSAPLSDAFPTVPEGLYQTRMTPATVEATVGRIVLHDAAVRVGDTVWSATSSLTPVAGALDGRISESLSWIAIEGDGLRIAFEAPSATLASHELRLSIDGVAAFPWATGRLVTGADTRRLSGEQVTLGGRFALNALGTDATAALGVGWLGEGDLGIVQVKGPAPSDPVPTPAVVAAGVAAAAGLGLLAYFAPYLKYGSTALLMPLYARLPRDRILEHQGREMVYELVRNEPGVSTHQLAARVEFSWSTLTYHLRVLEKNGKVSAVRDGRYKRFFDRENPAYANGRKGVVAVLRNDATRSIGREVLLSPGVSQKDLTERFDLSPSSVHWHVERLVSVGLLEKRRDGHHVRHYPGAAWREVPADELGLQAEYQAAFGATLAPAPVAPPHDPATV